MDGGWIAGAPLWLWAYVLWLAACPVLAVIYWALVRKEKL